MANLKSIFVKGINTIFSIFSEAVHSGTYTLITDNGFAVPISQTCPARCIFDSFTAEDIEKLSFSDLIQPTDIKGILPIDPTFTVPISVKGTFLFADDSDVYTVEGYDLDPLGIMYLLLLRKN